MRHHTKNRGLFVLVRREGDGNDRLFRWGIYRRRIPFGAKSTEGGFGRITLLILPEKRLSLNCLSRFSRKKTRRVIRTPFGAGGVIKISRSRRRRENGSPLRSRHAPGNVCLSQIRSISRPLLSTALTLRSGYRDATDRNSNPIRCKSLNTFETVTQTPLRS